MSFQWRAGASTCVVALGVACQQFTPAPLHPSESAVEFRARTLADPGLRDFMRSVGELAPEWPVSVWSFDQLTFAAFYFQPGLEVWRAQWLTSRAAEQTAAGRRNPVLTVAPGYSLNAAAGVSPWLPLASVDVPFETAGKRDLRRRHATELSLAAQLGVHAAAWELRSRLRSALVDVNLNERRAELLQRQLTAQAVIIQVLEQRLAAGAASTLEMTAARTARLRTEADATAAQLKALSARAQLAEVVGVPPSAIDPVKLAPLPSTSRSDFEKLATPAMRDRALQTRADLRAALADYAASETALRLEIARQYPDIHLNPGYQFDQGEHKWSLGISLELPLLNRNEGPIAEAEARRKESAARFFALQAQVISAMDQSEREFRSLLDERTRVESLVKLQQQQGAAVEAAFQAGRADRLELSAAQAEAVLAESILAEVEAREFSAFGRLEDALQQDPAMLRGVERSAEKAFARTAPSDLP